MTVRKLTAICALAWLGSCGTEDAPSLPSQADAVSSPVDIVVGIDIPSPPADLTVSDPGAPPDPGTPPPMPDAREPEPEAGSPPANAGSSAFDPLLGVWKQFREVTRRWGPKRLPPVVARY